MVEGETIPFGEYADGEAGPQHAQGRGEFIETPPIAGDVDHRGRFVREADEGDREGPRRHERHVLLAAFRRLTPHP